MTMKDSNPQQMSEDLNNIIDEEVKKTDLNDFNNKEDKNVVNW